ncbi:S-adenosyl-L-methionine-dependent methyltransferase [Laetiporus sulphureus 93-53]|uniref:S-adenosyl-L-methionine-dependent methyltransferase n=1 Tax=Laetiporus sulphureus 93-53 TaxID=1314785 RepID=A0A165E5S8_9APHY|nr:S-adenosyl-L-methionine-dependent methyltransferase [Laetiporus sulphureus 93-53]KZT06291.1 S-adenosyl-L-methionine-dependent methyltransferase [Laetiporus sulphureus 93-53]
MIPTPDLSHLTKDDYEHVYEPAEDTFILLDALEEDANELRSLSPLVCLEIGSGSGCVSSFVGSILGPSNSLYLCTDINPHACRCIKLTGRQNKIPLEPILASLAGPFMSRLRHAVDVLIFNPPYVPTYIEEAHDAQHGADIEGSWAGGLDGMQVTNVLLDNVEDLLSPKGRFYLVAVKQNDVPGIQARMQRQHGLRSEVVLQRRAGREHLFVVRFFR